MHQRYRTKVIALIAVVSVCLFASAVPAAVYNVTTTTDGGAGSLRQAVIDANANAGTDQINLPSGTYLLTLAGTGEDAAATGDLDITESVDIIGAGADVTTVDGSGLDTVFDVLVGTLSIEGVTISGGQGSSAFRGGGIYIQAGATALIDACAIRNNVANFGGGIRVGASTSVLEIRNSEISGNVGRGGAIESQGGQVLVDNCTISGNDGAGRTDGTLRHSNPNGITIYNSTIANNNDVGIVIVGGGGSIVVGNSIIALNAAGDVSGSPFVSQGYNLIGDVGSVTGFGATGDQVGTSASPIDPLLGSLQNNGGTTKTHALLPTSPALDAGDPANCPATDQRGMPRPGGGQCDIGAFERSIPLPVEDTTWGGLKSKYKN